MQKIRLPYIDNAKAVAITLAINLGMVFLFNYPEGITFSGIIWDTLYCAIITTVINICIVYFRLKKMKMMGAIPEQVPESRFMQRLPKNPILLGIIYATVFAVITISINASITWFFDISNMTFIPWLFYKLIYATILSVKIIEYCIFRYVQPDWLKADSSVHVATREVVIDKPIKNPLPRINVFKEMYAAVTGNIALNIILGSLLGGVKVSNDLSVVIYPTTVEGIPVTGLVLGLITGILLVNGIINSVKKAIHAATPDRLTGDEKNKWLTWMPKRKAVLICFISFCLMLFSAVMLWAIMVIFNIKMMNFFQFIVLITVYSAIIGKIITYLLIKRCMQTDYISFILKKKGK